MPAPGSPHYPESSHLIEQLTRDTGRLLVSVTLIRDVSPHKNIDTIDPRRGKRPDHHDTDDTQNNHDSRNLKQRHIHEKTPHSLGAATTKRKPHRAWRHRSRLPA
jgi:hypothetical protein